MSDDGFYNQDEAYEADEAPTGPDKKDKDKPKKFKGAQNPPADFGGEDVVGAKAKVNPQAVGAVLGDSPAVNKTPSPTEIEEASKEDYAKNLAPSEALVHEGPLQGDEEDPETRATEDTRSDSDKSEDAKNS